MCAQGPVCSRGFWWVVGLLLVAVCLHEVIAFLLMIRCRRCGLAELFVFGCVDRGLFSV